MRRIRPGQRLGFTAEEANAMLRAAGAMPRLERGLSADANRSARNVGSGIVMIRNLGPDIPQWHGVPLMQSTIVFGGDQQQQEENATRAMEAGHLVLTRVTHSPSSGFRAIPDRYAWGVAVEAIPQGRVGPVCVTGLCYAYLKIGVDAYAQNEFWLPNSERFASFDEDGKLVLDWLGPCRLVHVHRPAGYTHPVGTPPLVGGSGTDADQVRGWRCIVHLNDPTPREIDAIINFEDEERIVGYAGGQAHPFWRWRYHWTGVKADANVENWETAGSSSNTAIAINGTEASNTHRNAYGISVREQDGKMTGTGGDRDWYVNPVPSGTIVRLAVRRTFLPTSLPSSSAPNYPWPGPVDPGGFAGLLAVFEAPICWRRSPWRGSPGGTIGSSGGSGTQTGSGGTGSGPQSTGSRFSTGGSGGSGDSPSFGSPSGSVSGVSSGSGSGDSSGGGGGGTLWPSFGSSGGGGGSGGSGGGGTSSNCLLAGTQVRLADGSSRPIEDLQPGDAVASLDIAGLERDAPRRSQYEWLSTTLGGASPAAAKVGSVRLGTHEGFVVLNGRIRATHEHPFLIRRGGEIGFCSAELVRVGDELIGGDLDAEAVLEAERGEGTVRTVSIHVPGTNVYLAGGVWVHNDMGMQPWTPTSGSGGPTVLSSGSGGPTILSSGSGKSSGSSSFGSSGTASSSRSGPETGLG